MTKYCFIIAGPNGAGKTTFALRLLRNEVKTENFVNADLIALGLSPLRPENAAIEAGKLMLRKIDSLARKRENFAFETTLSGTTYLRKIPKWQSAGYKVFLYYFWLPSADAAVERVRLRVSEGGHDIPENVVRRRFDRSISNLAKFEKVVDQVLIFDTSAGDVRILEELPSEP
ncbi:putative ABC-type ATPase [Alteromonadaceae bacterium 2753L.S.0a.02]|nr:putative ABC-type ATPase [Alteromonadaceae bacterium 2753L.S.0a.02]